MSFLKPVSSFERREDKKGREYSEFGGKRYTKIEQHNAIASRKSDGSPGKVQRVDILGGKYRLSVVSVNLEASRIFLEAVTPESTEP